MKTTELTFMGAKIGVWYDPKLRLWTGVILNAEGDQNGVAEYSDNRDYLLLNLGARVREV